MRFYTGQHAHYRGVDLHTRTMYLCILSRNGAILLHRNVRAKPEAFLAAVAPYRLQLIETYDPLLPGYRLTRAGPGEPDV